MLSLEFKFSAFVMFESNFKTLKFSTFSPLKVFTVIRLDSDTLILITSSIAKTVVLLSALIPIRDVA